MYPYTYFFSGWDNTKFNHNNGHTGNVQNVKKLQILDIQNFYFFFSNKIFFGKCFAVLTNEKKKKKIAMELKKRQGPLVTHFSMTASQVFVVSEQFFLLFYTGI